MVEFLTSGRNLTIGAKKAFTQSRELFKVHNVQIIINNGVSKVLTLDINHHKCLLMQVSSMAGAVSGLKGKVESGYHMELEW